LYRFDRNPALIWLGAGCVSLWGLHCGPRRSTGGGEFSESLPPAMSLRRTMPEAVKR
jgi:hypothetical protein